MNKYKLALASMTAMSLLACGKGFEVTDRVPTPNIAGKTDLKGLSTEDVLKTKFDRAELKCDIWAQKNAPLDVTAAPNGTVSIDLKSLSAWPVSNRGQVIIENHKVTALLTVESVTILESLNLSLNGIIYRLKNTPQVRYTFQSEIVTDFTSGSFATGSSGSIKEINEGGKQVVVSGSLGDPKKDGFVYYDHIVCSLETQLKPEYQDEYQADASK